MENCINPQQIYNKSLGTNIVVICGKCPLCKHSHRMNWLMRCEQETIYSDLPNHWFLTLTYNEKKVPRKRGVKTLYKRHPQLFFKRLRKAGYKIKYILVGEYGSETSRPHYHALVWTNATYESIEIAWSYGAIHYREMAKETILYTLKYVLNPRQGDNTNLQREYAVYSKGIGLGYMTPEMYNYHKEGKPLYTTVINGKTVPLPRYYRKKIFTKRENYDHALELYYTALKEKWRYIKKAVRLGYEFPHKQYARLKHERAQRIIKMSNKKGKL